MPAPNIADLFDFETHYEDALANYFANINATPFTQILTPRTNLAEEEQLSTPRLELRMAITGEGIQEGFVPNSTARFYTHRTSTVTMRVVTNRDSASQPHGLMRGAVRQGMLQVTAAMNANVLPYYQTLYVNEAGSVQGIVAANDEIATDLTYAVQFAINVSQWPNV
jgi:hypothetical protein